MSKRTFFRYFDSKEDVALAPLHDLWEAFLEELRARRPDGGPLLALLRDSLLAALERMPAQGWTDRVLLAHRLAAQTPSMNAHGLQFCDRTTRASLTILRERFGLADPHDPRPRLALDMTVAAFHWAMEEWSSQPGHTGRDDLGARLRDAFAAIPASVTLTVG